MSRQETSNTFSDGLIKDLNPINTPDTALTDCVNGTIITYDGNEYSLQNDRGNYALENCKLPDGYIPVGTAEYGGILYIVSYDPINKRTEIGSYPSTRVVTKLSDPRSESKSGNSSTSGKYSELSAQCKLNIFSGANPEDYKLYPGDGYKLSNKPTSIVSRDEFFVVDENKALHDITDEIETSTREFIKVSWGVPGWIAVKTHIANIDSFGIGVRSVSYPTYIHADSKMKIKFRFRIIATDPLITNSKSGLSVTYTITDGSNTHSENKIAVTSSYSLGNGGKAYYLDTGDIEFPVKEDTAITVTATPYFHSIEYDKCTTTYTYKVSGANDIENVSIGKEVWKYKTLDDRVLIDFSTEGLEGYKSISDLELTYSIYSLNGTKIISRKPINDWIFSGMSTDLEIPFSGDFVSENIYVIKFELLSIPSNNNTTPLYSTSQLLITTKLLNDKYGTVANFNNLEFGDWITEYKNYINNNNIKIEESEEGYATPVDVPTNPNEFSPILITTGPYEDWRSGQESNNFNTLLSKSSYKKVTSAKEITVGRAYKYEKSFKLSTDTKLLAGPLWNNALQNCEANIWCNDTIKVPLTINTDGTVGSKNSTISGLCSIKSIYKPDALTNDGVRVWSYDLSSLDEVSNWTEEYIQCDLSTVKNSGDNWERVKVKVTSSSYPSSPEILSNEGLTLKATTTLANKLKTYDVMFLESITTCSASKTGTLYGATLNYKNIPKKPTDIHSGNKRDPKHIYFMALPASPSYDKMQVIQIVDTSDNETTENDAKNIFKNTLKNFNKLVCYDDEITGGFVKLIKKDTKEDSIVEVSCNGKITLGSVKYLNQNILEESGRNGLIDSIKKKFPEDINYNLLKSVEDWTELSSIDLTPIKKSFKISNKGLQSRLKESLDNDDAIISERNTLIEEQWSRSTDSVYITNLPNTVVYSKKDGVSIDNNINQILTLLNNKKQTTNTKALYKVNYWNNGYNPDYDRKLAFAYCDGTSRLT